MDKLPLDSLVIQEPKVIESKSDLRSYVYRRMNEPLENSSKYPPWKITLVRTTFINQVVLIIRVHQSICDGIGLLSTLIEQLADQAPPSTTTFIRTCQGTMTATNCKCQNISSPKLHCHSFPIVVQPFKFYNHCCEFIHFKCLFSRRYTSCTKNI